MRRPAASLLVAVLAAGCALTQPMPTPSSPSPVATLQPTPTPEPAAPSPTEAPTPAPTPGPDQVPRLSPGSQAVTNAPGLRVRSRPGTEQRVVTTLGVDAALLIGLGPVMVDGMGWYLVGDADEADPEFDEGWVAAGFEPDPFLIGSSFEVQENPYLAGFGHDASGEFGPVRIPDDGDVSVRWVAAPVDANGCSFAIDLAPVSGEPVRAIRSTVGSFPAFGDLHSQYFASQPALRGDIFVEVTADCSWALTFVRPRSTQD